SSSSQFCGCGRSDSGWLGRGRSRAWKRSGASRRRKCGTMAYADILCFFDASENSAETLNAATKLATAHGALLTGVDASQGEVGAEAGARLCVRFHETLRIAGVAGAFVSADALDEASLVHSCVDLIVAPSPG